MSSGRETEVLVVGGGPVGLFTALCLAERGIRVRVVEKYHRTALHSYAMALHPATLCMLDNLGLAQELIEIGQRLDGIALHPAPEQTFELELSCVESRFPFVLVVPQVLLEGALESRLDDMGVEVLWNHPALSVDAGADHVETLAVRTQEVAAEAEVEAEARRIVSSFVVGADGYDSLVRRSLGLDYRDLGGRVTYGLLEFDAPLRHTDRMELIFHGESTDVFWPIENERGRWNLRIRNTDLVPDVRVMEQMIRTRAPWFDAPLTQIHWHTSTAFERRLVDRFGQGRAWLVGDAAHLTSPIGVQSMNIGLREGHDLADRLTSILRDGASCSVLETYGAERISEWRRQMGFDAAFRFDQGAPNWADSIATRLVSSLPSSGRELQPLLDQLGIRVVDNPPKQTPIPTKSGKQRGQV